MFRPPFRTIRWLCLLGLSGAGICAEEGGNDPAGRFEVDREWKIEKCDGTVELGAELALAADAQGQIVAKDPREIWSETFGVRFDFPSKDVRGLTAGPDGRLYFFCGEGGVAIPRQEGGVLRLPEEGAVLRSEPDGSHVEIFCRGLHDPRGLAFDNAGNLFAVDASSGLGEEDRWLCLLEHGDYGWRTGWLRSALPPARVPWSAEKLWAPRFEGQAAWILPAVGNIPEGTRGLAHYPGMGLSPRYDDHFFAGNPARHTISTWSAKPNGGTFLFLDEQEVVGHVDAWAVAFSPGSKLCFAVPSEAARTEKLGQLYCLAPAGGVTDPQIEETQQWLSGGLKQKTSIEWRALLKHPDQRIRLAAEWALAASADGEFLLRDAALSPNGGPEPSLGRVHGIWGLGIVARHTEEKTPGAGARILEPLAPLLEDNDAEVRAQAANVLGEQRVQLAFDGLIKTLRSPDEKVSRFAAEALARLGRTETLPQLILMIRDAGDHDPFLRHAYVDALLGLDDFAVIEQAARHDSTPVRMAALLAMRQLRRPEIALFLHDEDPLLVREAATAINDEAIAGAWPALAALIEKPTTNDALMSRVLDAQFHLGEAANATALAAFAARDDVSDALRVDALNLLGAWAQPSPHDYVCGAAQSIAAREAGPAREALEAVSSKLLAAKNPGIAAAVKTARELLGRESK